MSALIILIIVMMVIVVALSAHKVDPANSHDHYWEKVYSYASLSEKDRSGTVWKKNSCKCGKVQNIIQYYDADGNVDEHVTIEDE